MGLLDDAIREHLELKRLRGADPSEVAREERAALGPPAVDEDVEEYDSDEPDLAEPDGESEGYDEEERSGGGAGRADGEADLSAGGGLPRSSEETMEVDMRTIIDAHLGHDDDDLELNGEAMAANAAACSIASNSASGGPGVDPGSVDWEVRQRRRWLVPRPVRVHGLAGPSVEGSLP
jgi:hypothetical protein